VRTPPSSICSCAANAGRHTVTVIYLKPASTQRVRAPTGWHFVNHVENSLTAKDFCGDALVDCLILAAYSGGAYFLLVSDGTDPGPRDLVFEQVDASATCP
jgi:hypothetical protein